MYPLPPLRPGSWRPELIIDPWGFRLFDPTTSTYVGAAGPLGRERLIAALPLNDGPRMLAPWAVVHDQDGAFLADPDSSLIGRDCVFVSRMLAARPTEATRR
jgi:hypothetical protein